MSKANEYRKKAEECLRDAEHAPTSLRLPLITIAQRWFELAEAIELLASERTKIRAVGTAHNREISAS
jgi:hypothetical protein